MGNSKLAGLGIAGVCVVLAVVFIFLGLRDKKFCANCVSTQGEITSVTKTTTTERTGSGTNRRTRTKTRYRTTFTYNVDGTDYTEEQSLNSSRSVGATTVYYLPNDPGDAKLNKPGYMVAFVAAVAMLIAGGAIGFKTFSAGG